MKEKIKRVFGWIKNNPLVLGVLGSLIATIIIDILEVVGVSLSKALYGFLITINPLEALELFFFSLFIVFLILLVKQRWGILKSKYDKLVELTKLPPEDKIITIEPTAYLEVVKREVSNIPDLTFILNVHNHSYYLFAPKRVKLKCYNSGEKVLEDIWDVEKDKEYISAKKHITVDGSLPKYQPKSIIFKVPIEKRYADWYNWDLEGYATYTNGEEERNVKIQTHHQMSDKNRLKLEKLLEETLGDDI